MAEKLNSVIAVIGIDIGKNSFHVVGLDGRGAIVLRQKWSRGQVEARLEHAGLLDRHGGLCWCPSSQPLAQVAGPRCPADAGEVRARLPVRPASRLLIGQPLASWPTNCPNGTLAIVHAKADAVGLLSGGEARTFEGTPVEGQWKFCH
jgi:hypothetical protein